MQVTAAIIRDLYPLYLDGEVSSDSRRLVEEFLAAHPHLREEWAPPTDLPPAPAVATTPSIEVVARTRRALNRQKWLQFFAILLTALPFSFRFHNGQITDVLLLDTPLSVLPLWTGAAFLWWRYERSRRGR